MTKIKENDAGNEFPEGVVERLIHYSDSPLTEVHSVDQVDRYHFKPSGLWVSVEGYGSTWKDWCESEEFHPTRLTHVHEIELAPNANILRLSGVGSHSDLHEPILAC